MEAPDTRSIPELVSAITGDLADLVRKEGELVRTEVSEKVHQAAKAGQGLGVGAALLLGAFLVLLQAAVLALSKVMDPLWASLIVGLIVGGVGFGLIKASIALVKPDRMTPSRSTRQLNKDVQLVKGQAR